MDTQTLTTRIHAWSEANPDRPFSFGDVAAMPAHLVKLAAEGVIELVQETQKGGRVPRLYRLRPAAPSSGLGGDQEAG